MFPAVANFNFGSVEYELRPIETSSFVEIKAKEYQIDGGWEKFYAYLRQKHSLDEDDFTPTNVKMIRKEEKMV